MDSFGKHKRRDEAKEISFKKFQKSATKHDTFVINDKGKRLWGFCIILWYWQPWSYYQIFKGFTATNMHMTLQSFCFR